MSLRILVTGGAGFIGSAFVRYLLSQKSITVLNLDKLTYASDLRTLESVQDNPCYAFRKIDICDTAAVRREFEDFQPDAVVHLAAETHVDRSIDGPADFVHTNVVGTCSLLQVANDYWSNLTGDRQRNFRFHHVSTDEVFGSLGETGAFDETSPYQPNSPYAASKAAADHFVLSWHRTYGLPVIISNCSNNYGPYQFPEKLIPLMIVRAVDGKDLPIYGTGENVRDWLYVDDHVDALLTILTRGRVGETYNIGGNAEARNIDIVRSLCRHLDTAAPSTKPTGGYCDLITFVDDRPGHDFRYAMDTGKIQRELGWQPRHTLETGLELTVAWYLDHEDWWRPFLQNTYDGERLGRRRGQ